MSRLRDVSEPSIIQVPLNASRLAHDASAATRAAATPASSSPTAPAATPVENGSVGTLDRARPPGTFTGAIGTLGMFPLRAIIAACVALRIHPNILTLVGAIINVGGAWALGLGRFTLAGLVMIVANIFDFIDGKVAYQLKLESRFGAFWDSTLDRFSDLALLVGLIYLYAKLGRTDYVLVAALTLVFSIMTSYARARAESLVEKCKVGFMERPERIVLFMIGAFTNRMAPYCGSFWRSPSWQWPTGFTIPTSC